MSYFTSDKDDAKPEDPKPDAPAKGWTDPAPEKSSSEEKRPEPPIRDWASI